MNPYLELKFNTTNNDEYVFKVISCDENVTNENVDEAMAAILTANPFIDGDLASKKSASLVKQIFVDFVI